MPASEPVRRRHDAAGHIAPILCCRCNGMIKDDPNKLGENTVTTLRTLAHDLSNAIENVLQASYLLGQAKLDDQNAKWLALINTAAGDAARINRQIRDILKSRS